MKKIMIIFGAFIAIFFIAVGIIVYAIVKDVTEDPIEYFDQPISYEGKTIVAAKVWIAYPHCAITYEKSEDDTLTDSFFGKKVVIVGDNLYDDQIITISDPIQIGVWRTFNYGTLPVISGREAKNLW